MESDLRGKVILITGASGGIGSATARALAAEGARLVLHAHRQRAQAEDVANVIVFLASDRLAGHVTGQTMVVAGGMEGRWLWQPAEIDVAVA